MNKKNTQNAECEVLSETKVKSVHSCKIARQWHAGN